MNDKTLLFYPTLPNPPTQITGPNKVQGLLIAISFASALLDTLDFSFILFAFKGYADFVIDEVFGDHTLNR